MPRTAIGELFLSGYDNVQHRTNFNKKLEVRWKREGNLRISLEDLQIFQEVCNDNLQGKIPTKLETPNRNT